MSRIVARAVVGLPLLLAAACSSPPSESVGETSERVIFGDDDFRDLGTSSPTDPWHARVRGTASLFGTGAVTCEEGACALDVVPLTSVEFGGTVGSPAGKTLPLCDWEQFEGQPSGASCTAFLVAEDLVATAGHCIKTQTDCEAKRIVFGFVAEDAAGLNVPTTVPESDVYSCTEIVARGYQGSALWDKDYAVVRLDRAVTDRDPLPFRESGVVDDGAPLGAIGSYHGLALKISDNAVVKNNPTDMPRFEANLDAGHGNSGGPVFDLNTGLVEGILVSGPVSDNYEVYTLPDGTECASAIRCSDIEGCNTSDLTEGEKDWVRVSRIRSVAAAVEGSCYDGQLSSGETDVDCGGPLCEACQPEQTCLADSDCEAPRSPPWGGYVACWVGVCGDDNRCEVDISSCECASDDDCDDGIACTNDTCTLTNNCYFPKTSECVSCTENADCIDSETPACAVPLCTELGVCNNDLSACDECTEETALDLGAPSTDLTVSNDACLRVRDEYPVWWGSSRTLLLQTASGGTYPTDYTWSNSCSGEFGSGSLTGDWQMDALNNIDSGCATLINLNGDGSGTITLHYFGG